MPYKSKAQQRKFHAMAAQGEISPKVVAEYDAATDFKHLPEHAKKKGGNMKKKHEYPTKAGNTAYERFTEMGKANPSGSSAEGAEPSLTSQFRQVPGSDTSKVVITPVAIGNKVPDGF